jgi:hypothetical protein
MPSPMNSLPRTNNRRIAEIMLDTPPTTYHAAERSRGARAMTPTISVVLKFR